MFGLGRVNGLNRKEYNNRVRNILENRLTIETDHDRRFRRGAGDVTAAL